MKYLIALSCSLLVILLWRYYFVCDSVEFNFAGGSWTFPATIQQVNATQKLDYHPPGYYYHFNPDSVELILDYHSKLFDFDDERQPKETLFPRAVHSYIFRFPEKPGVYDSLRGGLEKSFNSKFVLTKGLKDRNWTLAEEERPFQFNFLTASPCLTVGIKKSNPEQKDKIITVRFMYDLSLGYMGTIMGSY